MFDQGNYQIQSCRSKIDDCCQGEVCENKCEDKMIICIIEFENKPGMEEEAQKWLADLMPRVEQFPGFQGKESYAHISGDGRVNTVSYWEEEKSLLA